MNETNPTHGMDRADTGQWKLVIYISRTSLDAWLRPLNDSLSARHIVSVQWERTGDEAELLHKIESAVYDNPRLLEDYSADIIIESDRTMWLPAEISEDEEKAENIFTSIYNCSAEDMMADRTGEKEMLWWLIPGLPDFLNRTFPGARVLGHQSALVSYLDRITLPEGDLAVLNTRPGSCDVILLKSGKLQTVSTQRAGNPDEAIYRLLKAAEAYGINLRTCHIAVRVESGNDSALSEALEKMRLDASLLIEEEQPMPTAALISLLRRAGS